MVFAKLRSLFSGPPQKREAQALYIALVEQSRNAFFYTKYGVPDTLDGRFDVILLHMFLALHNMGGAPPPIPLRVISPAGSSPASANADALLLHVPTQGYVKGSVPPIREFKRLLLECLFDNMDQNLREMGVGDTGVGRRIKTMSKAAFGRLEAYTAAFASDEALGEAFKRNIYRGADVAPEKLNALVRYVREYNF